jgi:hypothetical protein
VIITRENLGWKGIGEYGQLKTRGYIKHNQRYGDYDWIDLETVPTVLVKKGERWPGTVDDETAHEMWANACGDMVRRHKEMERATEGMPADEKRAYRQKQERRHAAIDRERKKATRRSVTKKDTEFVYIGVPVYGLMVWTIEARRAWRAEKVEQIKFGWAMLSGGTQQPPEELIIKKYGPEILVPG